MEALNGTVMQLIHNKSAISFPASSTFPPPAATMQSQFCLIAKVLILLRSSSQQSYVNSRDIGFSPSFLRSNSILLLISLVALLLPRITGFLQISEIIESTENRNN